MSLASLCKWKRARRKWPPGIANLLIGAVFLNRFRPGQSRESPAEAGFEKLDEPETPRLKAGAKKSPLKRAEGLSTQRLLDFPGRFLAIPLDSPRRFVEFSGYYGSTGLRHRPGVPPPITQQGASARPEIPKRKNRHGVPRIPIGF